MQVFLGLRFFFLIFLSTTIHHSLRVFSLFALPRDNPSERLGNQKNGVKDIQKHKYDWQIHPKELLCFHCLLFFFSERTLNAAASWQRVLLVLQVVRGLQLGRPLPGGRGISVHTRGTRSLAVEQRRGFEKQTAELTCRTPFHRTGGRAAGQQQL